MATSSFNKDFTLTSKKAVESFEKIVSMKQRSVKVNKTLVSHERERHGEDKLRRMLSL